MTQDEMIDMARQSGMVKITTPTGIEIDEWWGVELSDIEHFAKIITEKEREACAKIADLELLNTTVLTSLPEKSSAAWNIAHTIRARSKHD